MEKISNKIFQTGLALLVSAIPVCALDLDMSVDEEIRRNYNPSKLELEQLPSIPETQPSPSSNKVTLPALPSTPASKPSTPVQTVQPPKTTPVIQASKTTGRVKKDLPNTSGKNDIASIKIKSGTKFRVKSQTRVSDWNRAGTSISFVSTESVFTRYVTFPAGTVFRGIITESHQPQASGNGGLLVMKATSMQYNGRTYDVNAKITKADSKKIFFNNIKGERKYWKNVAAQVDKGEKFYNKTRRASSKLSNNPIGAIISPIPTIFGAAVYTVNLAGSPLFAVGAKGGHINLPAGTLYEIKFLDDTYLY